jgi:DNA-binding transcriptional LysR family regulator
MGRIERRHLEAFAATAEAGSIAAAAARLHVSASAVSKSITGLEQALGRRLFERVPTGMVLADAAEKLLGPAHRALGLIAALEDPTREGGDSTAADDDLHIVSASSLSPEPLSWILGEYVRRHRGRRIFADALRQPELDSVTELVAAGHYDAGLTETPRVVPPGLTAVSLAETEFWAVLPPGASAAAPGEVSTDELLAAGLIVGPYWESSGLHRALVGAEPRLRGAVTVRSAHRGQFLQFVLAGLGAAMLRVEQAQEAAAAGCTVGRLSGLGRAPLSVLHRAENRSPSVRRFVEVCTDYSPPSG